MDSWLDTEKGDALGSSMKFGARPKRPDVVRPRVCEGSRTSLIYRDKEHVPHH